MASVTHPAAGKPPDQKAVDGAETQFACGSAVACAPDLVQDPREFSGGKIGSSSRPVFSVTLASLPAFFIKAQMSAVRRSCQTMALWIGLPVARSQMIAVSRWLVMPIATGILPRDRASATMAEVTSTVVCQISSGLCSTQPSAGKCCGNSVDCCAISTPSSSNKDGALEGGALVDSNDGAKICHGFAPANGSKSWCRRGLAFSSSDTVPIPDFLRSDKRLFSACS